VVVVTGILAKIIKKPRIFGKKILDITDKVEAFGWSFTGILFHLYIKYPYKLLIRYLLSTWLQTYR